MKTVELVIQNPTGLHARPAKVFVAAAKQFKADIPDAPDYETIAGFLQTSLGKMPEVNDELSFGDLLLTVVSKTQRRVRLVSVRRLPPEEPLSGEEE